MSSSDDDQLSESAGGFDLPLSGRKPASTPTRGGQNRASGADFNMLDSFDLPEEALQDKVGHKLMALFFATPCHRLRSTPWSCSADLQTMFCFRLSPWNTTR